MQSIISIVLQSQEKKIKRGKKSLTNHSLSELLRRRERVINTFKSEIIPLPYATLSFSNGAVKKSTSVFSVTPTTPSMILDPPPEQSTQERKIKILLPKQLP